MPQPNGQPFTTQQLASILAEATNDPKGLGYGPYLTDGDTGNICGLFNWLRDGVTPYPGNQIIGPSGTITGATNATPVVLTTTNALGVNDSVAVSGVLGNTGANGTYVVSAATGNSLTLSGSVGNGPYTSGGVWQWLVTVQANGSAILSPGASAFAIIDAFPKVDQIAATPNAFQCAWANMLASYFARAATIPLLVPGTLTENNIIGGLKGFVGAAQATSIANLNALKFRNGSRGEQVLNLQNSNQPGNLLTPIDWSAAQAGHY